MQKRKKQLLGLAGLALIAAITAIAFAIPAPGASAAETFNHSVGLTVKVEEKVPEGEPQATLIAPTDLSQMVGQTLTVKFSYKNSGSATTVVLEKYDADGNVVDTQEIPVGGDSCNISANPDGECTLTYDLGDFPEITNPAENANFGVKYKVTVTPKAGTKEGQADYATFFRRAAFLQYEEHIDSSTNNPYISVYIGDGMGVNHAKLQVYDKVTKQPILMENGVEAPLEITAQQIANAANGKIEVLLPLDQHKLKAGNYLVTLVAYNAAEENENTIVAIASEDVPYSPKGSGGKPTDPDNPDNPDNPDEPDKPTTPEVPGTGSIFRDLNISKADYLVVGLIAFGMVTGFAIFLIVRRNKR